MKDSTAKWLAFAEENLGCARLVVEREYYNAALQNAQQAVEKALKALVIERDIGFSKTHSIQQLRNMVAGESLGDLLTDEECELLDSIYLPSKYPLGSALPASEPDADICSKCTQIAETVLQNVHCLLDERPQDESAEPDLATEEP
ncbi:MAG: HEPN domain-containing protein [Verrucomicrobia bacterium]|jgi:HEPN domain-containing protein|nr:HEPN domain-containing protein [Verrucomicrobiota bacterium]MBT7698725.1 HEPN domain-containing protein [Verrucomicrobiota bacterium]